MDSVEVCPSKGVAVRGGRVIVGPCVRDVAVFYALGAGVSPVTTQGTDGRIYYIPRTNTWRSDGGQLNFFNVPGTYTARVKVLPCEGKYGVDVFARADQVVNVASEPVVPLVVTSEQNGTQKKHQMVFSTNAKVWVNVGLAANARMVAFSVDMSAPIAAGTHTVDKWVEVRGEFNGWSGGAIYRLARAGNVYAGAFVITGNAGAALAYKFYSEQITWEGGADRTLILGAAQQTQTVPQATWNV